MDGDTDGYAGARGIRFFLHPGSGLAKKKPKWVLAAELVETSRLFARCAARIEPEWIEAVAGERVTRDYFDPRWDEGRGEVVASERVQLYGLTLVPRRRVSYGAIDPKAARDVFIREALVPGALATKGAFLAHNRKLVAEVAELEHKARRQDVLVDDDAIAAFYAERIPEGVHSLATFEHWRAGVERGDPTALRMTREALMRHAAAHVTEELFPDRLPMAGAVLPLKYRFAPGQPGDGLTLTVPLAAPEPDRCRAAVVARSGAGPGKGDAAAESAAQGAAEPPRAVARYGDGVPRSRGARQRRRSTTRCAAGSRTRLGTVLPTDVFAGAAMPPHLAMEVRVNDAAGRELATGRDVAALRVKLGEAAQLSFAQAGPSLEQRGLKAWTFGDLPETLATVKDGQRLTGYPALVDAGDSVSITLQDTRDAAERSTRAGVIRLLRIALKVEPRRARKGRRRVRAGGDAAQDDDSDRGAPVRRACRSVRSGVHRRRSAAEIRNGVCRADAPCSHAAAGGGGRRLPAPCRHRRGASCARAEDRRRAAVMVARRRGGEAAPRCARLSGILRGDAVGAARALPRYLTALSHRLAKYAENPERDSRHSAQVELWWERYRERQRCPSPAAGRRAGARKIPLDAGGAVGFALRPGIEDAVSGLRQAPGKGMGGTLSLTIGGAFALSRRLPPC